MICDIILSQYRASVPRKSFPLTLAKISTNQINEKSIIYQMINDFPQQKMTKGKTSTQYKKHIFTNSLTIHVQTNYKLANII
jgi:hypothetical protein